MGFVILGRFRRRSLLDATVRPLSGGCNGGGSASQVADAGGFIGLVPLNSKFSRGFRVCTEVGRGGAAQPSGWPDSFGVWC